MLLDLLGLTGTLTSIVTGGYLIGTQVTFLGPAMNGGYMCVMPDRKIVFILVSEVSINS